MKWDDNDLFCADLPSNPQPDIGKILVTGATGYIGGRLVPELLARGYQVRVMVRVASPEHLERWPDTEIVVADALEISSLKKALKNVHTAYYLIHSLLLGQKKFESADTRAAINFRRAAEENNVRRIIYLGGLGDIQTPLSNHLRSRMSIVQELKKGKVSITVFRAAVIIGSGSASYEIIKHLVKNCPVLFIPRWARTKCQPIALRDVIKYLIGALEVAETKGKTYDIGGSEILNYEKMLKIETKILGKKKLFLHFPLQNIRFYSYIASLMTPVPAPIIRCLMESCTNDVICLNDDIKKILPFKLISCKEAILRAMSREERDRVYTRWSDAYPPAHELAIKLHELEEPIDYTSSYSLVSKKNAASLFQSICKIGGAEGWFHSNLLWRLRGIFDRILMGVGTSRGRRSSSSLRINDVIDFWRVEDLKYNELLLLRAEMKMPGRAWLRFNIERNENKNKLSVKAYYQTRNFFGKLYWYLFLPFHLFIFKDLIKGIEKKS